MISNIILWLAFLVLAAEFIVLVFTHIICIMAMGWNWLKDSVFDFMVLAAIVAAEILIFKTIY